jgi:hypothetical protein
MSHEASPALGDPLHFDRHLTGSGDPQFDEQVRQTYEGQAGFACGPQRCGECRHYGYWRDYVDDYGKILETRRRKNACAVFLRLMGRHGKSFPGSALSCRFFERPEG